MERVVASYLHRDLRDTPFDEVIAHYTQIADEQRRDRKEQERRNK